LDSLGEVLSVSLCMHVILQVPFFFKHAIDALSIDPSGLTTAPYLGLLHLTPVALLLGYGISRWAATAFRRNSTSAEA
jgi:cell division protein FtsX